MPSQAMQDSIDALKDRQQQASAGQAPPPLEELRAAFVPGDRLHAAGAGVDVTLQIGEGLPHVYQLLLGTPEAAAATEQIGKFLRAWAR